MVDPQSVEAQLKKIHFNHHGWGRSEAKELPNILLPDEEIHEVANGLYDGGFALLVATDCRVLLIDKKPLNYLTVEDFRFDMINEIDYNHRLFGAHINLSAGGKNLRFTSYNQVRLRKLISHVQHSITNGKRKQNDHAVDQKQHLEQINQQLQAYLLAQHQQQQQFQQQIGQSMSAQPVAAPSVPNPVKPSAELNDYLFAQSLLAQHKADQAKAKHLDATNASGAAQVSAPPETPQITAVVPQQALPPVAESSLPKADSQMAELYAEGMQEIYGKREQPAVAAAPSEPISITPLLEINPLKIAYSKLPMALRNKRFGRPSFHSHSQAPTIETTQPLTEN